jgi:PIN domain nuclease of toxin-antitoxin system
VLPLDLEVCIRSTELPALHADPCNRMMIAAAQVHHLPVVTTDPIFAQYGIEIISSEPVDARIGLPPGT